MDFFVDFSVVFFIRITKQLIEQDGPDWREKLPVIPNVPISAQQHRREEPSAEVLRARAERAEQEKGSSLSHTSQLLSTSASPSTQTPNHLILIHHTLLLLAPSHQTPMSSFKHYRRPSDTHILHYSLSNTNVLYQSSIITYYVLMYSRAPHQTP